MRPAQTGTDPVEFEQFGKYSVISRLGSGGMAEVFKARLGGMGGFEKTVAIKRILPERVNDPEFMNMFLDEARVAANLTHPNIAQVFEIGDVDGIAYIAMEYISGPTFLTLRREARRLEKLHFGHFAKVLSGICEGLQYAHTAKGSDGEPLCLVHRDVSPQNIIVSREGVPKLLDFGVAQAIGRLTMTRAGTIKGKIKYMAPEHLSSEAPVDFRSDIFSVGVCLFEACTGKLPFGGDKDSDVSLLKSISSGVYRKPSDILPDFPKELERIILWAIQPDTAKRCPTAGDLHDALESYVASGAHTSSRRALAQYVEQLVPPTPDDAPVRRMTPSSVSKAGSNSGKQVGSGVRAGARSTHNTNKLDRDDLAVELTDSTPILAKGRRWQLAAGVAAIALIGSVVFFQTRKPPAPIEASVTTATAAQAPAGDAAAKLYMDEAEKLAGQKRFGPALTLMAKAREVKVEDPALNIRLATLTDTIEQSGLLFKAKRMLESSKPTAAIDAAKQVLDLDPSNEEALQIISQARSAIEPARDDKAAKTAKAAAVKYGKITVDATPSGIVYLDDEPLGRTPLAGRSVKAGTHSLQIRRHGFVPWTKQIDVAVGKEVTFKATLVSDATPRRLTATDVEEAPKPGEPQAAVTAPTIEAAKPAESAPAQASSPNPSGTTTIASAETKPAEAKPATPSEKSKEKVALPHLPLTYSARSQEDLSRVLQIIENEAISRGGVAPVLGKNVTQGVAQALAGKPQAELYPTAMYYMIIRESALGHDRATASEALKKLHTGGVLQKLKLPTHNTNL